MKGLIIKSIAGDFHVLDLKDNKTYICKAKGSFRNLKITPICGDEVEFSYDESHNFAIINHIYERKNFLIRPPIANVDMALIIMSTTHPDFDSYLVDKLIVSTTIAKIEPIIVLSKCEYLTDEIKTLLDNYKKANYKVFEISSHQKINLDLIKEEIKGKKIVLCGQSAVGKSSLINALLDDKTRLIGEFSLKLGRGKHQTREVEFINIDGTYVADTPGFSRLDIKMELVDYARVFKDFEVYANQCRYSSCLHINEPGCAVKKAVNEKLIDIRRYQNYLHLLNEIKDGKHVWRKK